MNIKISEMTLFDLEEIKNILLTDFDNFWNFNILSNELASSNSKYLVAKLDSMIVGFAGIKIVSDEADIMNIVVKKSYRKNKIATLLLKDLILLSKQLCIKSIFLEVNEKNLPAIHLYENFRFFIYRF